MIPSLEARPTEYAGVVFRSKSEAVLARALDLHPECGGNWVYEPEMFKTSDGWKPDFYFRLGTSDGIWSGIIEYKPSAPTETYVKRLKQYYDELRQNKELGVFGFGLMIGNPWSGGYEVRVFHSRGDEEERAAAAQLGAELYSVFKYFHEARRYRFDLCDPNTPHAQSLRCAER